MTAPIDIHAAKALAEKATGGEWRVGLVSGRCRKPSHGDRAHPGLRGPDPCDYEYTIDDGDEVSNCYVSIAPNITLIGSDDNGPILSEADARFIAAARQLVPALCDEVLRLREELAKAVIQRDRAHEQRAGVAGYNEGGDDAKRDALEGVKA